VHCGFSEEEFLKTELQKGYYFISRWEREETEREISQYRLHGLDPTKEAKFREYFFPLLKEDDE
jgi:hypothetical protein